MAAREGWFTCHARQTNTHSHALSFCQPDSSLFISIPACALVCKCYAATPVSPYRDFFSDLVLRILLKRGFIGKLFVGHDSLDSGTATTPTDLKMAADSRRAEKMRLVVVGPGGVGKSAITLSFVRDLYVL